MQNTVAPTPAEQAVTDATAELSTSRQLLATTRALLSGQRSEMVSEIVGLAFQLGRMQGHAEAAQDRIAEMTAKQARTDTP